MAFSDYLVTDDLTILLALIAITVFLIHGIYAPQPLVHPILLGRQSDVGRVRNPGESAVYRNYGTGFMGRFSMRPDKNVNLLSDLVKPDVDTPRMLWSTKISNHQLKERISAFGSGLVRCAGLVPHDSNVLLLLNDSLEFLISDLALASHSIPSFTITSTSLLSPILESHPPTAIITHAHFLPNVLELIYDANESEHHIVIVVGDFDQKVLARAGTTTKVLKWIDVEREGAQGETITSAPPSPDDVFTISFFASETGQMQGAHLTHANLTAGVSAMRALVPHSNGVPSLDTVVSAHSLSTAFGRAVAYYAIFTESSFVTLDSTQLFRAEGNVSKTHVNDILSITKLHVQSPTVLFIKPAHLISLSSSIHEQAHKSLLYSFAIRHKTSGVTYGSISKDSLWDRILFNDARSAALGEVGNTIQSVVVSGGPLELSHVMPARIALSIPLVNSHIHPLVAGPVLASHPLDLQNFPSPPKNTTDPFAHVAHVGPPSVNAEAKLINVQDKLVENGEDPIGVLMVRGPSVGKMQGVGEYSYIEVPSSSPSDEGWVWTGDKAKVLTNGAFKVIAGWK